MIDSSIGPLIEDARSLAEHGERKVLGIVGAPGSGKSTLASALHEEIGPSSVVVPMDGFHLSQRELERLGRSDRKGALDTFDGAGFVSLLRRLVVPGDEVVYAPAFDRSLEDPVAASIPVPAEADLVIVEGNYLLVDEAPWSVVRDLLAESWFVFTEESLRLERLIARHEQFGRSSAVAAAFAHGSDQRNAELIAATRSRADRCIDLTAWEPALD